MALQFDPDALADIPRQDIDRIMKKIEWLWQNRDVVPHECLNENLSGFCKKRLGKYRIIYTYDDNSDNMLIHMVGLRDTIYYDAARRYS